ncbi:MAG: Tripartite ATP-independent periplasmic transporter, DctQ component [Sporomusa sp.]|jgi:TRAP-type C4-dicarboxylate transport system permease small subunit|nr:Tripartite ATP-independent periplasmic transporter, DctQ component [Sporomusa sp.]
MEVLKKIALAIDTLFESIALLGLSSMILIVIAQVMTRKLFNFVFFWSEEVTLLLLVWFAFMGMAIGFREDLHLGVDSFTAFLPDIVNRVLDKIIGLSIFAFGMYFIVYGWEFTVMMNESTLAATKLPNSILYLVMPVTGVMTCAYAALQVAGINTKRHKGNEVEMGGALGGEE